MEIKFDKAPTEVFIKNIGDRSDSKIPGYSVYHDAETHEGEIITVLSHEIYKPTTQFVKGIAGAVTVYVPLSTYHKLKGGSAAPEKPSQDAKYTGGSQPTPPAQQAAEKPKDYPWASGPLPEGEHTHTIEVLIVAPQMKDGVHRSYTNQSGKTSYKYDVAYVLDGFRRKATWESVSSSDPMLPLGQHQMVITVKGNFASIKKPRSGGGFGGGSAPADPKLTLLAGIVSNPTIPADKWGASLKHALEVLGGPK